MIAFSVALIGFTAMASQIIYVRELLVVFYGNELSISFILAGWLVGGAIGSAFLGAFTDRIRSKITVFAFCQILLGLLLPLSIAAARLIKPFLNINPGEIVPLFPIIAASFIILLPVCATLGFMFSLACRVYEPDKNTGAVRIGSVYILESIGAILGGALTGIILIRLFSSMQIAIILTLLNLIAAFLMATLRRPGRAEIFLIISAVALIIAILVGCPAGALERLEQTLLKKQWQAQDLVASKDSIYGNIALTRRAENYSFFENGLHLYTVPDQFTAEESAHLALLEHPDPKDVLLIGGGPGGTLDEILKEPVRRVDYVELDPLLILMARRYLPEDYYRALKDGRVSIKNTDGRFYVKTTRTKYDCVIVRAGDPYTAQVNRYYTAEFFKEAKAALKRGGILSFGLSSSESYISKPLGVFLSSIYLTVKDEFSECLVMPGETAYFVATDESGILTHDYRILEERTKKRNLSTRYVRDYYMSSKLSPEKIAYMDSVLEKNKDARRNRDFRPISYYYGLIFWTTLFKESLFSSFLKSVDEHVIWQAIGIFIILAALVSFFKRSFRRTVLIAVAAVGFSTMAFQILILLAFQILYGYLFYKLGAILTAFMAGLAIGAFVSVKVIEKIGWRRSLILSVQADLLLFSLLLPVFFMKFGAAFLFPVMSVIAGFIGGSYFPLANAALLGRSDDTGRVGGLSYGVDLFGSFLGAVLTGVFLIPILGIPKTCMALALINVTVLGLLALNVRVEE